MKSASALFALVLFSGAMASDKIEKAEFATCSEMRERVVSLYSQQEYGAAVDILDGNLDRYPDRLEANLQYLLACLVPLERYGRCAEILDNALNRGIWFSPWMLDSEPWAPVRAIENYSLIAARNDSLKQIAQALARPDMTVVTPDGFSSELNYPLFIALHGGGGNMQAFRKVWQSNQLSEQFIVAYVQSSQVISMTGFSWENRTLASQEVCEAYRDVVRKYPVDTGMVVVGGFSSGGGVALDISLTNAIPVSGFAVLCPYPSDTTLSSEKVRAAGQWGVRGTVITTALDPGANEHQKMTELFRTEGLQYQFMQSPDAGHWIPDDLGARLDQAISHIQNR